MAQRVQITCINKNDRQSAYERIARIGGSNADGTRWAMQLDKAIAAIEAGTYDFYTQVGGHTRKVVVATRQGVKYLKTEADTDTPDNLLSLAECPK